MSCSVHACAVDLVIHELACHHSISEWPAELSCLPHVFVSIYISPIIERGKVIIITFLLNSEWMWLACLQVVVVCF